MCTAQPLETGMLGRREPSERGRGAATRGQVTCSPLPPSPHSSASTPQARSRAQGPAPGPPPVLCLSNSAATAPRSTRADNRRRSGPLGEQPPSRLRCWPTCTARLPLSASPSPPGSHSQGLTRVACAPARRAPGRPLPPRSPPPPPPPFKRCVAVSSGLSPCLPRKRTKNEQKRLNGGVVRTLAPHETSSGVGLAAALPQQGLVCGIGLRVWSAESSGDSVCWFRLRTGLRPRLWTDRRGRAASYSALPFLVKKC